MIHDFKRPTPRSVPSSTRPVTAPRTYARPAAAHRRRFLVPTWAQALVFVPVIMLASIFAQSAAFGQAAVIAYGVFAFVRSIPSRTSFMLALLTMIATIVLLVGKGDVLLAQNFATYTFLFLVVGVVTLGRELKKEGGRIYSNRHR